MTEKEALNKENLSEVKGTNQSIFMNLQMIKELISRVLASQVMNQNVIGSWSTLLEYLKFNMSNLRL